MRARKRTNWIPSVSTSLIYSDASVPFFGDGIFIRTMLKLIATDLDGTLLDSKQRLPEEIFPIIRALNRRGILFCPASGRQYANLKKLFAPVENEVLFMAENGALVKYREETLYLNPIQDALLKDALDAIRSIEHAYPMLCGENNAYIEDSQDPFYSCAFASYTNCVKVNSLDEVIGKEKICKIAVYDALGSHNNCIKYLPEKIPFLRTILSGKDWCDVSQLTANKGDAMRFIKEKFSFQKEECMAFGDHMNDYEMLLECGNAFVTENAYPPLKKLIPAVIPANTEGGVLQKLNEILLSIPEKEKRL